MVEMHGWITFRETYKVTDDDNTHAIVNGINNELKKLKYYTTPVKWMNGSGYLQYSLYANHWSDDCKEILNIFDLVSKEAIGSYGLLYVYDDEALTDSDSFVVYKLARGKVERIVDTLLSPFIPTVEDSV